MPLVSIFIPHHRNSLLLKPLFTSLLAMDMDASEVEYVLVDNGSNDGSIEYTRSNFPEIKILSLGQNEGFAPAMNRAAQAYESEWICFLNNDVRVDVDWLSNLLHAANRTEGDCLTSHVLDWSGKKTQFGGGWVNLFGKGFESNAVEEISPYEVFFPCGCGMMVRREVFFSTGGFDDDYFMIYEDVDFGWRLQLMGIPVYLAPDAKIMHKAHASLNQIPYSKKALYYERNSLATIYKNLSDEWLKIIFPLALREAAVRAKGIGGIGVPFSYSEDGLAILEAVESFYDKMPNWREKRELVQNRRVVDDSEIFRRFFPNPGQMWAFSEEHYKRIHHPAILPTLEEIYLRACDGVTSS